MEAIRVVFDDPGTERDLIHYDPQAITAGHVYNI